MPRSPRRHVQTAGGRTILPHNLGPAQLQQEHLVSCVNHFVRMPARFRNLASASPFSPAWTLVDSQRSRMCPWLPLPPIAPAGTSKIHSCNDTCANAPRASSVPMAALRRRTHVRGRARVRLRVQPGASCKLQRQVFAGNIARWRGIRRDAPQPSCQRGTAAVPLRQVIGAGLKSASEFLRPHRSVQVLRRPLATSSVA